MPPVYQVRFICGEDESSEGPYRSSRGREESLMATMHSRINVASSGPRIASMTPGSMVDEGTRVFVVSCEAVALLIDHSKSAFERMSIVALMKGEWKCGR